MTQSDRIEPLSHAFRQVLGSFPGARLQGSRIQHRDLASPNRYFPAVLLQVDLMWRFWSKEGAGLQLHANDSGPLGAIVTGGLRIPAMMALCCAYRVIGDCQDRHRNKPFLRLDSLVDRFHQASSLYFQAPAPIPAPACDVIRVRNGVRP